MNKKKSTKKYIYEINGQMSMFGHDNLEFKTINMPKKQKFKNLCIKFNIKKPINNFYLPIKFLEINK
tara:strand:+ start:304 stop:504 length:201 start_codon:yes stop_codon:yes gene_type:complete